MKAAKAIRFFTGHDTFGARVERALSADGKWFARHKVSTRYGMQFVKWYETETPSFETHVANAYSGERELLESPRCMWGFHGMTEHADIPKVRLPA